MKNIMTTTIETITPSIARKTLEKHFSKNRPVRKNYVLFLSDVIKRGEWKLTHQGIAIGWDGKLYDGQHRLLAIIHSGCAVPMSVTINVDPESYVALDQHLVRRVSDIYNMPVKICEVANLAWFIYRDSSGRRKTPQQVYPFIVALYKPLTELLGYCGTSRSFFSCAASKLAAVLAIAEFPENKEYVFKLYKDLVLSNLNNLPPIAQAITRKVLRGEMATSGQDNQHKNLTTMSLVFMKENKDMTKIVLTDQRIKGCLITAKMTLEAMIIEDEVGEKKQRMISFL